MWRKTESRMKDILITKASTNASSHERHRRVCSFSSRNKVGSSLVRGSSIRTKKRKKKRKGESFCRVGSMCRRLGRASSIVRVGLKEAKKSRDHEE